MKQVVFYSWQSDLPNACNRGFIQNALEHAVAAIGEDESVAVEPVVDRDTQGVPGAPDIASTIFSKIAISQVFVADVSIVIRNEKRAAPNPNVLIELGYAYKALGHERIILVFNKAYGKLEELPFDLRMRRVLSYEMSKEAKERSYERRDLETKLNGALRAAIEGNLDARGSLVMPAVSAIESQAANRIVILRRKLDQILKTLDRLQPTKYSAGGTVRELEAALGGTEQVTADYSKIAETIAVMDDVEAALEVYRWFGYVFERYNLPENFSGGPVSNADYDYFKFLGHELFVTIIGFLIREQRWSTVASMLAQSIYVPYLYRKRGPGNVDWSFASQHLPSLMDESKRRSRASLHADILNARHEGTGVLSESMPMEIFVDADYFLFLFGELSPGKKPELHVEWRPWSALYLKRTPEFLIRGESRPVAAQIVRIFQITGLEEFKRRFLERAPRLGRMFASTLWENPVNGEDVERFGTQ